jgi:hypothetical protein
MHRVGFETTIPVFEQAKTVLALDRAAAVMGWNVCMYVCIRLGHKAGPCTATFNDLLSFPFRLALY